MTYLERDVHVEESRKNILFMMSISPESASIYDAGKKDTQRYESTAKDVTNEHGNPHSEEYGRYLELHHKFEGERRAKLIRKCEC